MVNPASGKIVLIFDGTCGFCSRSVRWIQKRDVHGRLRAVPSQQPGLLDRYGLTQDEVDRAAWTLDGDGNRLGGAAAINRAMAELPGPWSVIARLYHLRPIGWVEDGVYRWVAGHRRLMSRLWREQECAIPTITIP